eukprot:CAMPEP_0180780764 /NCGR_PEP_ID=MMETSP1038_2-20121128/47208_1 /TAXON_ID=632150 /ORGANISM="Azadinium spinosum, Strain 3D9" /LENGTH=176 /DNA_ID=CAMNT_0022816375 /DNA_START=424 /DNA_END=951 /DNA_ORIENTATION=+
MEHALWCIIRLHQRKNLVEAAIPMHGMDFGAKAACLVQADDTRINSSRHVASQCQYASSLCLGMDKGDGLLKRIPIIERLPLTVKGLITSTRITLFFTSGQRNEHSEHHQALTICAWQICNCRCHIMEQKDLFREHLTAYSATARVAACCLDSKALGSATGIQARSSQRMRRHRDP